MHLLLYKRILSAAVYCTVFVMISAAGGVAASEFTVALLQMEPHGNDLEANGDKAENFCREAARHGADLALMPEMWSIGYTRPDPDTPESWESFCAKAVGKDSPYIARFQQLARELNLAIAITYLEACPAGLRNTLTLFDRQGNEVLTYAKVHTSDFKHMEANMIPGDGFVTGILDTQAGPVRIGAMICFDREQPESARILMLQGAEIIITPNACRLDEMRLDQFKIRAYENAVGVAMTNYPGDQYEGRSVAYAPDGKCLALAGQSEEVVYARFDLETIRRHRSKTIWGNAYRRPHKYGPLVGTEKEPTWNRTDGNGEPYNAAKR